MSIVKILFESVANAEAFKEELDKIYEKKKNN